MLELREKRVLSRLTQYDIVTRARIPQSTYSLIERGYKVPNDDERQRLARALGCQVDEIEWEKPHAERLAEV
jgi:transcriptional regulator with XRE-family HTH domain